MSTVSVNTHFPGYEILGELGRSNARVLKARHVATGSLVAIKHFTLGTDADTLRRFQQESVIMTGIQHPNVVQVREVQLDRPMPYIVMEWVEGGDLRAILTRQGPLDTPTLLRLGLQMAGAFGAIHPEGIIHRDLKPENILYRPLPSGELHFLLTDFGVARLREQAQTMTGQSLMTYEYASPEQFNDPRAITPATDYYSLGVVLYECLTGRVPFSLTDGSIATFMNQVLHTPPPPVARPAEQHLPPSLATLLTWMLVKDPAERLSDVNELTLLLSQANVELLQASRSGGRPAAMPTQPATRPAPALNLPVPEPAAPDYADNPTTADSTWWGILAGLLVVGLMIGLVVYYKQRQPAPAALLVPDSTATRPDSSGQDPMAADTTVLPVQSPVEVAPSDSATTEPIPAPAVSTTASDSTSVVTDSSGVNN